jgi:hypothetical protein
LLHAATVYAAIGNGDAAEMELKEGLRLDPALERARRGAPASATNSIG